MEKGKTYREYRTITREHAFSRGFDSAWIFNDYDSKKARDLFTKYPEALEIEYCRPEHNEPGTRYRPDFYTIIYVKSTQRRSGSAVRIRLGAGLRCGVGEQMGINFQGV